MYLFAYLAALLSVPRQRQEEGASAVEYSLLVVLIAAIIVAAVAVLGTIVLGDFNEAGAALPD